MTSDQSPMKGGSNQPTKVRENCVDVRMTNHKSQMKEVSNQAIRVRKYDLELRTHVFAKSVRNFLRLLPRTISNIEDSKQLLRSSGSVCANYIETAAAVSEKDFMHRMKICRKEAKESWHWLDCLYVGDSLSVQTSRDALLREALELSKIFSASIRTFQNSHS